MVTRKGELSKRAIDREYPHQVALQAHRCAGPNYVMLRLFCEGLSLCERGHAFHREGVDHVVFCFAVRDHAEKFQARFGGQLMHASDRPKWPGKA